MNDLIVATSAENIITQHTDSKNTNENLDLRTMNNIQKPIPRNPSKIVAEKTSDMFMSGLMCE